MGYSLHKYNMVNEKAIHHCILRRNVATDEVVGGRYIKLWNGIG